MKVLLNIVVFVLVILITKAKTVPFVIEAEITELELPQDGKVIKIKFTIRDLRI